MGARWVFAWVARGTLGMPPQVAATFAGMESLLLSGVYLLGLALCFFTAFGTAFVTMYSSSDLPLLFCAPLTVRQIFAINKPCLRQRFLALTSVVRLGKGLLKSRPQNQPQIPCMQGQFREQAVLGRSREIKNGAFEKVRRSRRLDIEAHSEK